MPWVNFNLESGERVAFNTHNISAITECKSKDGNLRTLIEVESGKDFFIDMSYDAVMQTIGARQKP